MELKKIESKKAQEFSITTLVVLVLAVIVLVVVVLGFWKGWDYIFGKIGLLPSNLEATVQSCSIAGESSLVTSYCYEFKSVNINGAQKYVNCETLRKSYPDVKELKSGSCDAAKVKSAEEQFCSNLKPAKDININDYTCVKKA